MEYRLISCFNATEQPDRSTLISSQLRCIVIGLDDENPAY
jgi:hypothetical protein